MQAKRQRIEPYCMIHCTDDCTQLVTPNSLESWKTLKRAGEIRNHEGILSVQVEDGQIPNEIWYHRKCRSIFTHKRELDRIESSKNKEKKPDHESQTSQETERRSSIRQGTTAVQVR